MLSFHSMEAPQTKSEIIQAIQELADDGNSGGCDGTAIFPHED
jgi:hypothetical protein